MTNSITLDPARAERAMRKIKEYQAKIAEYEETVENLKDVVATNLPTGETVLGNDETGYLRATVYQARQFNEAFGKKNAPEVWEKHAVTTRVLTSTEAKKSLSVDEYALFQKPSAKMSVKVEVLND